MWAASIAAVGGMTEKVKFWVLNPATATERWWVEESAIGLTVASRSWSWVARARVAVEGDGHVHGLEGGPGGVEPQIEVRRHIGRAGAQADATRRDHDVAVVGG